MVTAAADSHEEAPATVLNSLMEITRVAGAIGIPGLYVTDDPGAADAAAKKGALSIRFGLGWAKSHSFFTGQTPVMKYNQNLMQAILWDRLPIADIVNVSVVTLDQAPDGYRQFDGGAPQQVRDRSAWDVEGGLRHSWAVLAVRRCQLKLNAER